MISHIIHSAVYRGTSFVGTNGLTYYLMNGQSIARSSAGGLSAVWPEGCYGSTANAIHLPDVNNLYFRGHDFGRNADIDRASRVALSGSIPTGTNPGSYQAANMQSHIHTLAGAGGNGPCADSNGQDGGSSPDSGQSAQTSTGMNIVNTGNSKIIASGTTAASFDVTHTRFYAYICGGA